MEGGASSLQFWDRQFHSTSNFVGILDGLPVGLVNLFPFGGVAVENARNAGERAAIIHRPDYVTQRLGCVYNFLTKIFVQLVYDLCDLFRCCIGQIIITIGDNYESLADSNGIRDTVRENDV